MRPAFYRTTVMLHLFASCALFFLPTTAKAEADSKRSELSMVNRELDHWQREVSAEIAEMENQLSELKRLQRQEDWKFPDAQNPPKDYKGETVALEARISAKKTEAQKKITDLLRRKAELEKPEPAPQGVTEKESWWVVWINKLKGSVQRILGR